MFESEISSWKFFVVGPFIHKKMFWLQRDKSVLWAQRIKQDDKVPRSSSLACLETDEYTEKFLTWDWSLIKHTRISALTSIFFQAQTP